MTNELQSAVDKLSKETDRFLAVNYELTNRLHQKIEELGKNQIYLERLQAHTDWLQSANQALSRKIQEAEWDKQQVESRLNHLLNSKAWRLTAPFRWISNITTKLCHKIGNKLFSLPSRFKPYIKVVLVHTILFIRCRPRLKRALLSIINRIPKLRTKISSLVSRIQPYRPPTEDMANQIITVEVLGHRAKKIYNQFSAENNSDTSQQGL